MEAAVGTEPYPDFKAELPRVDINFIYMIPMKKVRLHQLMRKKNQQQMPMILNIKVVSLLATLMRQIKNNTKALIMMIDKL